MGTTFTTKRLSICMSTQVQIIKLGYNQKSTKNINLERLTLKVAVMVVFFMLKFQIEIRFYLYMIDFINFSIQVIFIYRKSAHCIPEMIINSQPKVKDNKEYSPIKMMDQMSKISNLNKNSYKQHQPGHQINIQPKVPLFFKGKKPLNKIDEDKCAVSVYNSDMSQSIPIAVKNNIKNEINQSQPTQVKNSSDETNSPFQKLKQLATPIIQKDIIQNLDSKNQKEINIFYEHSNDKKCKKANTVRSPEFFKLINQKRKQLSLEKKKKKNKINQVYHNESDNVPQFQNVIKKKTHHKKSSSLHNTKEYCQKNIETKENLKGNQKYLSNLSKISKKKQQQFVKLTQKWKNDQNHNRQEEFIKKTKTNNVLKYKTSRPQEQKLIKQQHCQGDKITKQNKSILHSIKSNQNLNFNNKVKRHYNYQINENHKSFDSKKYNSQSPFSKQKQQNKINDVHHDPNIFPVPLNLEIYQNKFESNVHNKQKEDKTRTDRSYKEAKQQMSSSLGNEQHYKSSQALQKKQKKGQKKKIQKSQHIPSFFVQRRKKNNPESTIEIKFKKQENQMQFNSIYQIEQKYMSIIKKLNNQLLKLKKEFNDKIEIIQKQTNLIKEYQTEIEKKNKQLQVKNNQIMQIQKCLNISCFDQSIKQISSTTNGKRNSRTKTINNQAQYERSSSLSHKDSPPKHSKFNVFELEQYKKKILDLEILSKQLKEKLTQRSIQNSQNHHQIIANKIHEKQAHNDNYHEFNSNINSKNKKNNEIGQNIINNEIGQNKTNNEIVQNNSQLYIEVQTFEQYQIQVSPPISRRNSQISDD